MTTYTASDRSWDLGVPKQDANDFGVTPSGFITGEYPTQFVQDIPVAPSQTLAAYTVVGLNGSGQIVPAVLGTTQAIGFLMYPVTSGAGQTPVGRILRSACFNPNFASIVWPATYDTLAKKINAFAGAPSPTQFVARPLSHGTPVTP